MFPASAKLCDFIALSASRLSARFSRRRVAKQMRLGIALFAVGASKTPLADATTTLNRYNRHIPSHFLKHFRKISYFHYFTVVIS